MYELTAVLPTHISDTNWFWSCNTVLDIAGLFLIALFSVFCVYCVQMYFIFSTPLFGAPQAPLYCFQKLVFVWLHVRIYIYIYIYVYICQDGGAEGFVDFTKLLFALYSLAQPLKRVIGIPEHFFVILSQRKAYAGRFREETAEK